MKLSQSISFCFFISSSLAAFQPCPPLGPFFPNPPSEVLAQSPLVKKAFKSLDAVFNKDLTSGTGSHGGIDPNTSFSVALFSVGNADHGESPFLHEYHYTAPSVKNSKNGVTEINSQSVYRLGDVSKVFTIYTFLSEAGDGVLNQPVVKYVPELAKIAGSYNDEANAVDEVDWQSVTVGQLASHMSGIGRDYVADLSNRNLDFAALGFPELSKREIPKCGLSRPCSRQEFFSEFTGRPPVVAPGQTPIFSNAAYQILSYVLESISGKPFESIFQESILNGLNLKQTTLNAPASTDNAVIPGKETTDGWLHDFGDESPAVGMYTSLSDLSRTGASILTSTLLPAPITRRWLKPVSLTSNHANSVGMPWTIYSQTFPSTTIINEVFTALGGTGHYSSYLGLVPSINVGFAILSANAHGRPDLNAHADIVGDEIFSAVLQTAAGFALEAFGGTYSAVVDGEKASLTLGIADEAAELGMQVTQLKRGGVDVLASLAQLKGIKPKALSMRVYPTGLEAKGKVAWRAVLQDMDALADAGTPTCVSWMGIDLLRYGGEALDRLVFSVGEKGAAETVEIPALKMTLKREG